MIVDAQSNSVSRLRVHQERIGISTSAEKERADRQEGGGVALTGRHLSCVTALLNPQALFIAAPGDVVEDNLHHRRQMSTTKCNPLAGQN
jgi:hypothetical protein